MVMELRLVRKWRKEKYTIGNLYINGVFFSNTIEDTDRNLYQGMNKEWINERKIYGSTAIPKGRYRITLNIQSPKYSKSSKYYFCKGYLPRLLNVPCWEGVLIHIGNYPKDTLGCILVGENKVKGAVINSTKIFKQLYEILKKADDNKEEIWINITD